MIDHPWMGAIAFELCLTKIELLRMIMPCSQDAMALPSFAMALWTCWSVSGSIYINLYRSCCHKIRIFRWFTIFPSQPIIPYMSLKSLQSYGKEKLSRFRFTPVATLCLPMTQMAHWSNFIRTNRTQTQSPTRCISILSVYVQCQCIGLYRHPCRHFSSCEPSSNSRDWCSWRLVDTASRSAWILWISWAMDRESIFARAITAWICSSIPRLYAAPKPETSYCCYHCLERRSPRLIHWLTPLQSDHHEYSKPSQPTHNRLKFVASHT